MTDQTGKRIVHAFMVASFIVTIVVAAWLFRQWYL